MKYNSRIITLLFLTLFGVQVMRAQEKLTFSVVSFEEEQFDTSARNDRWKKIDGSGSLYAIIKVKSDHSSDDLRDYQFNFGNMNHFVEMHEDELWVYVQKNAKWVTITRSGYATVHRYDLRTTIQEGRTYAMQLSSKGPVIRMQMVQRRCWVRLTRLAAMPKVWSSVQSL